MGTVRLGIGLGVIALGLVVLVLAFRNFGIPLVKEIGESTSEALSTAGKGITDFFDSFDPAKLGSEIIDRVIPSLPDASGENVDSDGASDFAFGFDLATAFKNLFDNFTFGGLFNPFPDASGETSDETFKKTPAELAEEEAFLRSLTDEEREIDETPISTFTDRNRPDRTVTESTPQGSTQIEGIVRSELDTQQEFKVFSSDSSQSVFGVIRQTELDPNALQVDSLGNPTETASERAERLLEETSFDFGTNAGSALKIETGTTKTKSLSLAERLKIEAEKGALIFDSRSITNF